MVRTAEKHTTRWQTQWRGSGHAAVAGLQAAAPGPLIRSILLVYNVHS